MLFAGRMAGVAQTSYHVTTSQGLSTHQLTVLTKDHQNNMWFGSYNGLHKHEGTSIKLYKKSAVDSNSLSSNEIHPVYADRQGYIWAGTTGGLDKIDPATDKITHYKLRNDSRNDDNIGYIYSIFQDANDAMWLSTDLGVFVVDYATGKYRRIADNDTTGNGMPETQFGYKASYGTKDGIWMVVSCRLVFYDYKSRQFFNRFNNPHKNPIFTIGGDDNTGANTEMTADSAGNLFFVTHNSQLIKYNIGTHKIDSFPFVLPKDAWKCCYSLAVDYKNNIWVGFRHGGLMVFNQSSHQFSPIKFDGPNSLITSNYVYSLCEDYLRRMWVSTNNGIYIINYYDTILRQKYLSDKPEFLHPNYEAGLLSKDNKGNIYIPFHAGGLFQYNVFTGNNRHFPITDTSRPRFAYAYVDDNDELFISSRGTLMKADTSSHRMVLQPPKNYVLKTLMGLPNRLGWIYKHNDTSIYYRKTNNAIYYAGANDTLKALETQGFMWQASVSKDRKYLYFIGGNSNLIRRDLNTLAMDTIMLVDKLRAHKFLYSNTSDVVDDGNGNIWVTSQNGLIRYNIKTDSVHIYTTANGLLHDFTFSLCSDSKNRLWVGSMGGVNLYDIDKDAFINVFTESPDKFSDYFGSSIEAADNHIYFLLGSKLININPDGFLNRHLLERQLLLSSIEINGKITDRSQQVLSNLNYMQNSIHFRFGLLEFAEPEKVKYYYQLQGLDDKWVDLGNHSEVTFNSLQPGEYHLAIRATDVYGNMVRQTLNVPFTIHPPFWQTIWFKSLYLILIGLLIFWYFKQKQKKIKQQEEELEIQQAINYFSTAMHGQKNIDEMLWSVTKNCIAKLGFVDCVIYLIDEERKILVQKAAHGPKNPVAFEIYNRVEIPLGSGIVGSVAANGKGELIRDTSKDKRYIVDDQVRIAEIAVPIMYEGKVLGVIDSEDPRKGYFKDKHLSILNNIASICAIKIVAILAEERKQNVLLQMAEQKRKLEGLEIKALKAQMNPHFIFNAMNSIQHFSLQNDFDNANKYLSRFSKLLRMALQQSENPRFSLADEIEMLEPYLSIEALRLGADFSYNIEVDEEIETDALQIPSMIVQPFVENALKHGLSNKKGERKLFISFTLMDDKYLRCIVEDNGIGRKKTLAIGRSRQELTPHQSLGMKLVKERLALLDESYSKMAGFHIHDLYDANGESLGTRVEIVLPVE